MPVDRPAVPQHTTFSCRPKSSARLRRGLERMLMRCWLDFRVLSPSWRLDKSRAVFGAGLDERVIAWSQRATRNETESQRPAYRCWGQQWCACWTAVAEPRQELRAPMPPTAWPSWCGSSTSRLACETVDKEVSDDSVEKLGMNVVLFVHGEGENVRDGDGT